MKKLSELLRELADHAENVETKAAAAEKETSEKVHAAIDTSKADAKARQDEFKSNVAKKKAAAGSDWTKLQQEHNQRVEKIKGNIAAKKDAVDRKRAEHRAEDAEEYAADSIYFASIAIDDAEIATLEAIEARAHAESLV
jgi:hypothetical protein